MDAFYRQLDEFEYEPTEAAVGPWASDLLHGGPPIALLAHAMRLFRGHDGLTITRLSMDFLGPVPLARCRVALRIARPGKRIELLEATLSAGGRDALLARAWRMQREVNCATTVRDTFEPPPLPGEQAQVFFPGITHFPYAQALEWRFAHGSFDALGPASVWARPRIPLVQGMATSGLERLLILLDSANGVSAELPLRDWSFVPVDLQLSLHREPEGEWMGMDARSIIDASGVGTAHTVAFDAEGACARSLHTLFVRPR
ncbi:MAG: thioesterase family protein [Thiomonas sp.]